MQDPGAILQRTFDSFKAKMDARDDIEVPARQFIQVGEIVYDQPQLAVHTLSGPYQGQPGQPSLTYSAPTGGIVMLFQQFAVTIVRNWPIEDRAGRPPTPGQYSAISLQCTHDALVLKETFEASAADNSILGECDTLFWSGIEWIGPVGATIGTRLSFVAQL